MFFLFANSASIPYKYLSYGISKRNIDTAIDLTLKQLSLTNSNVTTGQHSTEDVESLAGQSRLISYDR